ncbi:MAG: ergothioneine biosynthesis glutamate--cysteine ligase EgtA [Actinobacteria bacterium]|nr:ergothioneine biosynthesis glutamate--cysteine ligase EgtA [Actinomycetota bacterium]
MADISDADARPTVAFLQNALSDVHFPAGSRLTFEPGGQLELSSVPARTPDEVAQALRADVAVLRPALRAYGLDLRAEANDSGRAPRRVSNRPRYEAMQTWFEAGGWTTAREMMCNTASVQVNIGCGPDPVSTWRRVHALIPVLAGAFAASSAHGWASSRLRAWAGLDPSRTSSALSSGDPVADWAAYALAANTIAWRDANGEVRPADGAFSLAEWIAGAPCAPRPPTVADLDLHVSTLFPPVRLKGWLEIRVIDMLPDEWWPVPIAVTSSLLGTGSAGADNYTWLDAVAGLTWQDAGRQGLGLPALAEAADHAFALSEAILEGQGSQLTELVSRYRSRFIAPQLGVCASRSAVRA